MPAYQDKDWSTWKLDEEATDVSMGEVLDTSLYPEIERGTGGIAEAVPPFLKDKKDPMSNYTGQSALDTEIPAQGWIAGLSKQKLHRKRKMLRPTKREDALHSSIEYIKVMRAHYINPIFDALDKIQSHTNSHEAAVYINQILNNIRELEVKSPNDIFLDILYALYDALVFDDNWIKYAPNQYGKVKLILEKYDRYSSLKYNHIEKALYALEDIGLDILPFYIEPEDMSDA